MPHATIAPDMQQCIEHCLDCYQTCFGEAMQHCLPTGGKHVEAHHFGLMMNCAEICRTAAEFMMTSSPLHARVCAACAEVCDACAASCENVGDMETCMQACRTCADSCRHMAGTGSSAHGFAGSQSRTPTPAEKAPM